MELRAEKMDHLLWGIHGYNVNGEGPATDPQRQLGRRVHTVKTQSHVACVYVLIISTILMPLWPIFPLNLLPYKRCMPLIGPRAARYGVQIVQAVVGLMRACMLIKPWFQLGERFQGHRFDGNIRGRWMSW